MIIVLDASAAVRAVLEPASGPWLDVLERAQFVLAPSLLPSESANALWKYVRAKALDRETASSHLISAINLVDEYRSTHDLAIEAFDLAVQLNRAAYDVFYLVLARRTGATLLTADKDLKAAARQIGVRVA